MNQVDDCIRIASNLGVLWEKGNYRDKQRVQKAVFPEGMYFNKKLDRVLTPRVNEIFRLSSQISSILSQKNAGSSGVYPTASRRVAPPGIEPGSRV